MGGGEGEDEDDCDQQDDATGDEGDFVHQFWCVLDCDCVEDSKGEGDKGADANGGEGVDELDAV